MRCKRCGYRLEHLAVNRCPECGIGFDPDDVSLLVLPPRHPRVVTSLIVLAPVFFLLGFLIAVIAIVIAGFPINFIWPIACGLLAAGLSIPVIAHAAAHRR